MTAIISRGINTYLDINDTLSNEPKGYQMLRGHKEVIIDSVVSEFMATVMGVTY